jgi:diacylglycerol kinase family enzyme
MSWRNKLPSAYDRRPDARSRNETERICCVLNPRAAAGRAGQRVRELERALERTFVDWTIWKTEGPGHATELAARALDQGFHVVASVGGDGTANEVVNGFFDGSRPRSRTGIFALIPWGTGSDLQKSLKSPGTLADALWVASTGMTLPTDVGHVQFKALDGSEGERVFINVAGFGANGDVVHRANSASKKVGGRLTFLQATMGTLVHYEAPRVRVSWKSPDGDGGWEGDLLSAFVANGRYCGGGMDVGGGGSMHDGCFDLTILPTKGRARNFAESWRLYDGSVWKVGGARRVYASQLTATSLVDEPVLLDIDGEQPGALEATFTALPRQLQVRGGWLRSPLLTPKHETWRPS